MSLPYRWRPDGTTYKTPEVGDLIPHEHRVYRVVQVYERDETDWTGEDRRRVDSYREPYRTRQRPRAVRIRPVHLGDDVTERGKDLHFQIGGRFPVNAMVYPSAHYPICATCREPLPCRDQMAEQVSGAAMKRMARYETTGICPECEEVITARQSVIRFEENLEIIGGPPITFHARRKCSDGVWSYEQRHGIKRADDQMAIFDQPASKFPRKPTPEGPA
jgi:hypothetical protein